MPTISQLTATSSVTNTDQIPVYSTDNGDARKASLSVIKSYILTDVTLTDPILIAPDLGTPTAGNLINCIGLPLTSGVTGILSLINGGSGASTADGALTNFGGTAVGKALFTAVDAAAGRSAISAAKSGANSDITALSGLTTALSVPQGGTGTTTLTANAVILGNGVAAPTFVTPGTVGNVLTSDGTTWQSTAPASGGLAAAVTKTANYTAIAGDVLACNTITTGAFSITLPAAPVAGDKPIIIFDAGTTDTVNGFATNNLTVLRNGSTIHTLAEDVIFSTKGVSVIFEYIAGTWRMRIG